MEIGTVNCNYNKTIHLCSHLFSEYMVVCDKCFQHIFIIPFELILNI